MWKDINSTQKHNLDNSEKWKCKSKFWLLPKCSLELVQMCISQNNSFVWKFQNLANVPKLAQTASRYANVSSTSASIDRNFLHSPKICTQPRTKEREKNLKI